MLDFLVEPNPALPTLGIYHPKMDPPGMSLKIKESDKPEPVTFLKCELKEKGAFSLQTFSREEAAACYIYRLNNFNLGLVLNLQDVEEFDIHDIRRSLIDPTEAMLLASAALPEDHPIKEFGRRLLHLGDKPLLAFVKALFSDAKNILKAIQSEKEERTVEQRLRRVKVLFDIYVKSGVRRLKIHDGPAYEQWSAALSKQDYSVSDGEAVITDMFGATGKQHTQAWSPVSIPKFGRLSPFQRNDAAACYAAYGFNSIDTSPVTTKSYLAIYDHLKQLTSLSMLGKTWRCFHSPLSKQLLLVVPKGMKTKEAQRLIEHPNLLDVFDINFSEFSGQAEKPVKKDEEVEEIDSVVEFVKLGKQVIDNLQGQAKHTPDGIVRILIIKSAGDGGFLTVVNQQLGLEDLAKATEKWVKANEEGKGRGNRYVTVADAWRMLNLTWTVNAGADSEGHLIKDYKDKIFKNIFSFSDILRLFTYDDIIVANRAVDAFGRYHAHLMLDVTKRKLMPGENLCLMDVRQDYRRLKALASIIFSKKGMSMPDVEEQPAYLMGVCVGLIDKLHRHWYEIEKKKGTYPKQFLGSTFASSFLMGSALMPWTALQQASIFLISWARPEVARMQQTKPQVNAETGKKPWGLVEDYSRYCSKLSKIKEQLGATPLPRVFTNEQKALFSLGFGSTY